MLPKSHSFLGIESFFFNFFAINEKSVIYFVRYLNILYIFSCKLYNINLFCKAFHKFLSLRNISLPYRFMKKSLYFPLHNFNVLGCSFTFFRQFRIIGGVDIISINKQKLKLKAAIKNFINSSPFLLIQYLNVLIVNWKNSYALTDFFLGISTELDFYLQKLLWKWAKHRHPRRTNIWIYSKYWRNFLGKWKFFAFDTIASEIIFINSHFILFGKNTDLPYSISLFDIFNFSKVNNFCYKRVHPNMYGIYALLFKKQKGLCFICKKAFTFKDIFRLKIFNLQHNINNLKHFVLSHNDCKFF